jgi:DNA-binding response OmpR family regulator
MRSTESVVSGGREQNVPLNVLLVESNSDVNSMKPDLESRNFEVIVADSYKKAASHANATWPDVVVVNDCAGQLDINKICSALDATELDCPCLIVSRSETDNHHSADAYLAFPFSSRQLLYRINKAIGSQCDRFLRLGDITLDSLKRQVKRGSRVTHLTPKEFRLLHLLMNHPGEVLKRRTIMNEVWETDYLGDTRTLDVHIRWVREKLEDDPSHPQYVVTVRGVGYRFHPHGAQP